MTNLPTYDQHIHCDEQALVIVVLFCFVLFFNQNFDSTPNSKEVIGAVDLKKDIMSQPLCPLMTCCRLDHQGKCFVIFDWKYKRHWENIPDESVVCDMSPSFIRFRCGNGDCYLISGYFKVFNSVWV